MGKRGPAPAPTALKLVRGERSDRVNRDEPEPEVAPAWPKPPSWITNKAKVVWRRLAPDLHAKGVLTTWDVDEFAALCSNFVSYRTAQEIVDREGVLVEGYRGSMVKNPAVQIARDYHAAFLAGASRFGMTPSDRSALQVGEGDHATSDDDLLTG